MIFFSMIELVIKKPLPTDTFQHCLSFLNLQDVARCSQVCREWNQDIDCKPVQTNSTPLKPMIWIRWCIVLVLALLFVLGGGLIVGSELQAQQYYQSRPGQIVRHHVSTSFQHEIVYTYDKGVRGDTLYYHRGSNLTFANSFSNMLQRHYAVGQNVTVYANHSQESFLLHQYEVTGYILLFVAILMLWFETFYHWLYPFELFRLQEHVYSFAFNKTLHRHVPKRLHSKQYELQCYRLQTCLSMCLELAIGTPFAYYIWVLPHEFGPFQWNDHPEHTTFSCICGFFVLSFLCLLGQVATLVYDWYQLHYSVWKHPLLYTDDARIYWYLARTTYPSYPITVQSWWLFVDDELCLTSQMPQTIGPGGNMTLEAELQRPMEKYATLELQYTYKSKLYSKIFVFSL